MSAEIKKLVSEPAKAIKEGAEAIIKKGDGKGAGLVFWGAMLSPLVSRAYAWIYDMSLGKIALPEIAQKIIKIALPLLAYYPVNKAGIPAGKLISGSLLGIAAVEIINALKGLVKMPQVQTKTAQITPGATTLDAGSFLPF